MVRFSERQRLIVRAGRSRAARVAAVAGGLWYAFAAVLVAPNALAAKAIIVAGIVVVAALFVGASRVLARDHEALALIIWDASEKRIRQSQRKKFLVVNGVQCVAAVLAIIVANALGFPERILPLIVIIVGVHFLPLAVLFRAPSYVGLGAAMIVGGAASFAWSGVASEIVATGSAALSLWVASACLVGSAYRLASPAVQA